MKPVATRGGNKAVAIPIPVDITVLLLSAQANNKDAKKTTTKDDKHTSYNSCFTICYKTS